MPILFRDYENARNLLRVKEAVAESAVTRYSEARTL